jgi:ATP-dependent RNA helicase RhlE
LHCTQKWRISPPKCDVRAASPIRFRAFPLLSEMTARCEPHLRPEKADDCGSPDLHGPAATRVPRNSCAWPQQMRICAERLVLTTLENTAETVGENGFAKLGITGTILATLDANGFTTPTPIQVKAIPPQIGGRDVLGVAQTGSGKTAAFVLPIIREIMMAGDKRQHNSTRALILVPTRELAVQIDEAIRMFAKHTHLSTCLVLGGMSRFQQIKKMLPGVDFLIATPGRLYDLMQEGAVKLKETKFLVLDEADRMLDMGFIKDVRKIAAATNPNRRTALFSATMPDEIEDLARTLMKDPVRVEVSRPGTTVSTIVESMISVTKAEKRACLAALLNKPEMERVIVFTRTKHGADAVVRYLEKEGFKLAAIHGNKSQNARQKALGDFKDGVNKILVATDIAARGIDVQNITHVINFELPDDPDSYVHRIGRTARNGATGIAITLVEPAESDKLRYVEKLIRHRIPEGVKPAFTVKVRTEQDRKDDAAAERKPFGHRGQQRPSSRPGARSGAGKPAPFQGRRREEGEIEPVKLHPAFAPTRAAQDAAGPVKKKRRFRPNRAKSRAA